MPLGVLLPLVIAGIGGIAILMHLLGLSRTAGLAGEHAAHAAWASEYPDDPALGLVLSRDRKAALVHTARGAGIVWCMGADTTARYLTGARITRTARGLRIALPDTTAPRIGLRLDPDETRRWTALMEDTA